MVTSSGAPRRTRTSGLLIRSQTLYPTELWVRIRKTSFVLWSLYFDLSIKSRSKTKIKVKSTKSEEQSTKIKLQRSSLFLFWWRCVSRLKLLTNHADQLVDLLPGQLDFERRHAVPA
jgi:hypothetical protein